jgi:hypothetical protein
VLPLARMERNSAARSTRRRNAEPPPPPMSHHPFPPPGISDLPSSMRSNRTAAKGAGDGTGS